MHTNKILIQDALEVSVRVLNGDVLVRANNVTHKVSSNVLGFDLTETETARSFTLWLVKATGLYRCDFEVSGTKITFDEALFVSNARSVAAKLTTVGVFVAVLVGQQLQLHYANITKPLAWSVERKVDFDLEVDYSGQTIRVLYSKTASPEQVYVDEYTFSGITITSTLSIFDFKFGVTSN